MSIKQSELNAAARTRTGNKVDASVASHFIPDAAIALEMREAIIECTQLFGASSARVEKSFWTVMPPALVAPASLTPVAGTAGILATGTYAYQVSANRDRGESLAGTPVTVSVTGPTGSVALSWPAVATATGYTIYGRTAGFYQRLATVQTTTWTDEGRVVGGSGPPANNTSANSWLQDYDVDAYIGDDVLVIDEVIRSDQYRSDALLDYNMVDAVTGVPFVHGAFIDMGFQQSALESQQAIERALYDEKFDWDIVGIGGRTFLRLMPPPEQSVLVVVTYLSSTTGLEALPENARIPLEYAACEAILNCILNRTDSDPPETSENFRDRRTALDTITKQRDRYAEKYRGALGLLSIRQ